MLGGKGTRPAYWWSHGFGALSAANGGSVLSGLRFRRMRGIFIMVGGGPPCPRAARESGRFFQRRKWCTLKACGYRTLPSRIFQRLLPNRAKEAYAEMPGARYACIQGSAPPRRAGGTTRYCASRGWAYVFGVRSSDAGAAARMAAPNNVRSFPMAALMASIPISRHASRLGRVKCSRSCKVQPAELILSEKTPQ